MCMRMTCGGAHAGRTDIYGHTLSTLNPAQSSTRVELNAIPNEPLLPVIVLVDGIEIRDWYDIYIHARFARGVWVSWAKHTQAC